MVCLMNGWTTSEVALVCDTAVLFCARYFNRIRTQIHRRKTRTSLFLVIRDDHHHIFHFLAGLRQNGLQIFELSLHGLNLRGSGQQLLQTDLQPV